MSTVDGFDFTSGHFHIMDSLACLFGGCVLRPRAVDVHRRSRLGATPGSAAHDDEDRRGPCSASTSRCRSGVQRLGGGGSRRLPERVRLRGVDHGVPAAASTDASSARRRQPAARTSPDLGVGLTTTSCPRCSRVAASPAVPAASRSTTSRPALATKTAAPEPATLLLLGAGMAALGRRRLRRESPSVIARASRRRASAPPSRYERDWAAAQERQDALEDAHESPDSQSSRWRWLSSALPRGRP